MFACHSAGLATYAPINIDCHSPSFVTCFIHRLAPLSILWSVLLGPLVLVIFTLAKSDPLPVESVKDSDRDVNEFKLGRFRSLANGVFQ
jgi:hypothetical protein